MTRDASRKSHRRSATKGVFCLEGDWWGKLYRTSTVEPILELLGHWDPYYVPHVRRDVATRAEFDLYLGKWLERRMDRYPILYLAFHGEESTLLIGDSRHPENRVTLDELGAALQGRCARRIIYFGSCGTLALHGNSINAFLRKTGALAVCGYRHDVEWLGSTAFELLALGALQEFSLTRRGAEAARKRIFRQVPQLASKLQFHMAIRG